MYFVNRKMFDPDRENEVRGRVLQMHFAPEAGPDPPEMKGERDRKKGL
jgi:hypothetical protein